MGKTSKFDVKRWVQGNWKMLFGCILLVVLLWNSRLVQEGLDVGETVEHKHGLETHTHEPGVSVGDNLILFDWVDHGLQNKNGKLVKQKHRHMFDKTNQKWWSQYREQKWHDGKRAKMT